jgi:hypothetical protein
MVSRRGGKKGDPNFRRKARQGYTRTSRANKARQQDKNERREGRDNGRDQER